MEELAFETIRTLTPFLVKGIEEITKSESKALWEKVKSIFNKANKEKILQAYSSKPTSEKIQGKVEYLLQEEFEKNPRLAEEIEELLQTINYANISSRGYSFAQMGSSNKSTIHLDNPNSYGNISGKNINLGQNYGHIGDQFNGIKQREFTYTDLNNLVFEIEKFKKQHRDKVNSEFISLGNPGDKESTLYCEQIFNALTNRGYKVEFCTLKTFGYMNKNYDVSFDPENRIMVGVYSAPNV